MNNVLGLFTEDGGKLLLDMKN